MIKTSIYLQDLRRRIYAKVKAELSWRFWAKARSRLGFGWKRWSRRGLYEGPGLFSEFRVQRQPARKASPT
jgi:hypothetical protein